MNTWRLYFISTFMLVTGYLFAQDGQFEIDLIESTTITNLPEVQSFVAAKDNMGRWLIIGGRIDGLHKRRPFEAFLSSGNNQVIAVINPASGQLHTATLTSLPSHVQEQLQSTNMEFQQVGNELYIMGGYAYSSTHGDHITFGQVCVIDVDGMTNAIVRGSSITDYVESFQDNRVKLTGGYLGYMNNEFLLVGGQNFEGRYNPMGPHHGPGFKQEYSNEIKRFTIEKVAGNYAISNYRSTRDSINLHRRDYNLVAQMFPNGSLGYTAFSGVFQHHQDLPFLNCVDISDSTYQIRNDFNQLLSQYHSAHLPIYDSTDRIMSTLFFGGIAQYYFDNNGILTEDQNVPFVKTISKVTRDKNDSLKEVALYQTMPDLLGAGAEFIPANEVYFENGILYIDRLPAQKTLVGYIYGGIKSDVPNGFFNNSTMSSASSTVYEVYIDKTSTSIEKVVTNNSSMLYKIYPNPIKDTFTIEFNRPTSVKTTVTLYDHRGKKVIHEKIPSGEFKMTVQSLKLKAGIYVLNISEEGQNHSQLIQIVD